MQTPFLGSSESESVGWDGEGGKGAGISPSGQAATAEEKRPRAERTERTSLISFEYRKGEKINKERKEKQ